VIGVVLALGLLTASQAGLLAAVVSARFGRRVTLAAIGMLMAACGFDLALAHQAWLLTVAGLTGMMGVSGTDLGPFLSVEQSVLAQASDSSQRNRSFARYSFTGSLAGAVGGFAAAAGSDVERTSLYFLAFGLIGLLTAAIALLLSSAVEGTPTGRVFGTMRPLIGLSALFGLDAFGSGMVGNGITVYWLHIKFGAGASVLGPSFAAMSILTAVSQGLAGRIADRVGLINTMVFTHLPSNVLLALVPFMPSLGTAVALLLARSAISSMDQPARQAYIVSIVKPDERAGAIAFVGAVRGVALSGGPIITGAAIQAAASGLPFIAGGIVKGVYDLGLYWGYRRRFGDHETVR
jgi:MFS family permease